ncbi:hypothetical protein [Lyngbya sp. PCC 8106]|uniref:hypothetical protein n=1 Tax=Lyngbya sp. (strain PCC 8106) TaxID=313612 RepID=UPI0000EAB034|nr:hypothetical protein [Lyngbya sp. PCC 8106]EAW39280.1 hypothetical protein L8106_05041 [Lyngbya sp. PCC 8106]
MNFHIEDIVQKVKAWFPKAQAQIEAQAAEIEARFNEQNYSSLSPEEVAEYQNTVQSLALPEAYENAIQTKLSEVLTPWKKNKDLANHLFIVLSPIEPLKQILEQTLEQVKDEALSIKTLSWENRPDQYSTLKINLQEEIESSESLEENSHPENTQSLIVIPDLSLCFLRCVEGLDSIEYLFDFILKDHSRFWIVGCNQWAWKYFDYLYKVNTGFEHIFSLPTLNAIELKQWLNPIYGTLDDTLDIEFSDHEDKSNHQSEEWHEEENWISKKEKQYFQRLADISEGLSQPAAHLWLDSLRYVKQSEEIDSETVELQEEKPEKHLILKRATLPSLPEFTKEDQYLLSSIGLHGEISLSALAVSLAESEYQIRIQVQRLLRTGIILQKQGLFQLSPIYYSRLTRDLIDNHILAGEKK